MHFYGKESQNTKDNLAHLKDYIALLPEWLQFKKFMGDDGKIKKSRQSTEILENNLLGNELKIHASAKTLAAAQNLGRGSSGNIIYYDECEFMMFFPEILANSGPLYKTASESAIATGRPACRLFSTTPLIQKSPETIIRKNHQFNKNSTRNKKAIEHGKINIWANQF